VKYDWNPEKNEWLKQNRGVSFEEIILHVSSGGFWKVSKHPNQGEYPGQSIYYVVVEKYVYLVPHRVEDEYIFLKTIIPSRKATREYRKEMESLS